MENNGIPQTIESYNAVIGSCALAGEWEPALVLYSTIENDVRGLDYVHSLFRRVIFHP